MANTELEKRKENYKKIQAIEQQFCEDIFDIVKKYENQLNDTYYNNDENFVLVIQEIYVHFLYEKLITYKCEDAVRSGLLFELNRQIKELSYEVDEILALMEVKDYVTEKINIYIDKFAYPEFNAQDAKSVLVHEILNLEDGNIYRCKLTYALMYSLFEGLDEIEEMIMINDILVDYDFNYKIPKEIEFYVKEKCRQTNYIPDFSNVNVGDTWSGGRRKSDFIRALKLMPQKAGTHSRKAQEDSIARSCEWIDDGEKKILTLTKIYSERLPKIQERSTRKYEKYFDVILRYLIQERRDGFVTTSRQLLRDIGVVSKKYKKISLHEYSEEEYFKSANIGIKNLENNMKLFSETVDECFGKIRNVNLKYLEDKKIIKVTKRLMIASGQNQISIDEINEWGVTVGEAYEMIEKAKEEAIKQIEVYDKTLKKKVFLKDITQVRYYHRYNEYKKKYEKYLKENYGWSYTYEELCIKMPEELHCERVAYRQYIDAQKELNRLLVEALKTSINTKDTNLKDKYNKEEEDILSLIDENEEIKRLYESDVLETADIKQERQYVYPDNYLYCVDKFIKEEIII